MATATSTAISEEQLKTAVESILSDNSFKINCAQAKIALKSAAALLEWRGRTAENRVKFASFSEELIVLLEQCFKESGKSSVTMATARLRQEKMWGHYHRLRTSSQFLVLWENFLSIINKPASPAFIQHITHHVFKQLIKIEFEIKDSCSEVDVPQLTHMEENAIRYVAGYVLHKTKNKLEKLSHPLKEAMMVCLMELGGYELEETTTEEWTDTIDRGGLWHINDNAYHCFYLMEIEIRQYLLVSRIAHMDDDGIRNQVIDALLSKDDLLAQWMLTTATEDEYTLVLFRMVIELYLTIRGFAFVKSCLELYKQATKKQITKSKGIRKELFTSRVSTWNY